MLKYLLVILLLVGCGAEDNNISPPDFYWEAELISYYDEFVVDATHYGVDVPPIGYVSTVTWMNEEVKQMHPERLGVCITSYITNGDGSTYEVRQIEVTDEMLIDATFKAVIYHEFGHCFLGKEHTNNPESLMYPYIHQYTEESLADVLEDFFLGD